MMFLVDLLYVLYVDHCGSLCRSGTPKAPRNIKRLLRRHVLLNSSIFINIFYVFTYMIIDYNIKCILQIGNQLYIIPSLVNTKE